MSANKVFRDPPLWATLVGASLAATIAVVASFFVFAQSGEAAPQAADERSPHASASITPWILGGTEVPNGKYSFMAFLDFTTPNGQSVGLCGGTLIDQDSVLTAAHCFYDPTTGKSLIGANLKVQVIVGRTVHSSNQGQVSSVKRVSIHPAFKGVLARDLSYDAAVVALSRPVRGITPIKLATSKQDYLESPGRTATVAGWGDTIATSPFSPGPPGGPELPDRMHEAQVPIVSDSSAKQAYDPHPETQLTRRVIYSPSFMIAAGGNGEIAPCYGDSGGPLFVALTAGGGNNGGFSDKYTQIGIISFSAGCAYKGFPVVYTEVNNPSISSFIKSAANK